MTLAKSQQKPTSRPDETRTAGKAAKGSRPNFLAKSLHSSTAPTKSTTTMAGRPTTADKEQIAQHDHCAGLRSKQVILHSS